MKSTLKKGLRTLQAYFPFLKGAKDFLYLHGRRLLRIPHERDFEIVKLLANSDGPFIDVGANYGQTIESILLYKPGAKIVSFEADPALGRRLARRYAGRPNVVIHSAGLADEAGTFTLYVPVYNGFVYDGLASLDRAQAEGWLNERTIFGFDRSKLRLEETKCAVDTLDSFDLAPAFMKVDVQGFEYNVLLGGLKTLAAHKPVLLIEGYADDHRMAALLGDIGYREYRFDRGRLQPGRMTGANSLLMTPETADALAHR